METLTVFGHIVLRMSLDFSGIEEGDKIKIEYTVYRTLGTQTETRKTTTSTIAEGVNEHGNLEWRAGNTGIGFIREGGHVFDGNGAKVGVDATVEKLD